MQLGLVDLLLEESNNQLVTLTFHNLNFFFRAQLRF